MQTEFRSLYEITGKITDHNMLVVPAAKLKALTLYEKLAEEYGLSIFPDLEALAAEIALLRTGYAAARLEIESLQARIKTMAEEHADELMVAHLDGRSKAAQQPGAAYAALPYKQALGSTNCMQCCVSYMMGLPLENVPDFATDGGWERFSDFAETQGYVAVMLPGNREYEADYLASGTTARGTSHMVVMNDGKLVHDPHPSNEGLVDVQCVWLLAKRASSTQGRQDEHAAFEASAKTYTSNVSFERDASDYVDMTASLLWHGWKLRASHGQAPAQAAPAAVAPNWTDAANWLRNNYQDYPNIASLCEGMIAASPLATSTGTPPINWENAMPGGKYTDKWESSRVADYNRGWNDYRKESHKKLKELTAATTARAAQDGGDVAMTTTAAPAQAADSVSAPASGANWQDISTAPKDGTRFVAVGQNYGLDSEKQHTCIAQWLAGCWVEVSDWNGASKLKYLTHWMPLPPLPGSATRKQGGA